MIKVDNFKLIESLLFDRLDERDDKDSVIFGRIIRRRKENPGEQSGEYIVKRYTFTSKKTFILRQQEIKDLCHLFNARFYITTNVKSIKNIAQDISERVPKLIRSEQYYFFKRIFDNTGDANKGIKDYRLWVFDIDDKEYADPIIKYMMDNQFGRLYGIVPTINGTHLLVEPHDTRYIYNNEVNDISADGDGSLRLKDMFDIKKNALTLIYYNDRLEAESDNRDDK
jgi:hypothetical protein